jgi:hypothetical protein
VSHKTRPGHSARGTSTEVVTKGTITKSSIGRGRGAKEADGTNQRKRGNRPKLVPRPREGVQKGEPDTTDPLEG